MVMMVPRVLPSRASWASIVGTTARTPADKERKESVDEEGEGERRRTRTEEDGVDVDAHDRLELSEGKLVYGRDTTKDTSVRDEAARKTKSVNASQKRGGRGVVHVDAASQLESSLRDLDPRLLLGYVALDEGRLDAVLLLDEIVGKRFSLLEALFAERAESAVSTKGGRKQAHLGLKGGEVDADDVGSCLREGDRDGPSVARRGPGNDGGTAGKVEGRGRGSGESVRHVGGDEVVVEGGEGEGEREGEGKKGRNELQVSRHPTNPLER